MKLTLFLELFVGWYQDDVSEYVKRGVFFQNFQKYLKKNIINIRGIDSK